MVFMLCKWEILQDPFGSLALHSAGMVIAPLLGFWLTALGFLDPIINIFYKIPDPWEGRGLTSFVMSIVFVQFVIYSFIKLAFNDDDVQTRKHKKRT